MTHLIVEIGVAALDIVGVVLVDGVVTEVHAGVPQVLPRVVVLHRGKPEEARGDDKAAGPSPDQALLVQVDNEGVV
jgi:hypothetical protein